MSIVMRLVPRVRTLLPMLLVLLVLLLISAAEANVSKAQLEALEEALQRGNGEVSERGSVEVLHRDKRQFFGTRRRQRNQNLYPGDNGPSIIYQGLYIPDPRFNPFADGIITNMVSEMRLDSRDPVYFRLNSRGTITEHESVRGRVNSEAGAGISSVLEPVARLLKTEDSEVTEVDGRVTARGKRQVTGGRRQVTGGRRRSKRQLAPTRSYSTALLEGLTNVNRRGDVEVQVSSNITLVRGRWLVGPLVYRVNFYDSQYAVRSLAMEIPPIQMDTVTQISYLGSDMADFVLGCPLMSSLRYRGNVTSTDTERANTALHNLFQFDSFMYRAVRDKFKSASSARLPLYSATRSEGDIQSDNRNNALLLRGRRRRGADEKGTAD